MSQTTAHRHSFLYLNALARAVVPTAAVLCCGAVAVAADDPAFTVKPVMMISCAPASEVPHEVKPFYYEAGFKISYLVQGQDIIGIKDGSLSIDTMTTAAGKDVATNHQGNPTWKMGTSEATEDGTAACFTMTDSQPQFGAIESLVISGHIVVLTASKREKKSIDLAVAAKDPVVVGPYTLAVYKPDADDDQNTFGITFKGGWGGLISCSPTADGKKLKEEGWSDQNADRTYEFTKTSATTVTVNLEYWADCAEHHVAFTQGKPAK